MYVSYGKSKKKQTKKGTCSTFRNRGTLLHKKRKWFSFSNSLAQLHQISSPSILTLQNRRHTHRSTELVVREIGLDQKKQRKRNMGCRNREFTDDETVSSSSLSEALLFATMCIIGLPVDVHVKDGSVYSGIFYTASVENEYGGFSWSLLSFQCVFENGEFLRTLSGFLILCGIVSGFYYFEGFVSGFTFCLTGYGDPIDWDGWEVFDLAFTVMLGFQFIFCGFSYECFWFHFHWERVNHRRMYTRTKALRYIEFEKTGSLCVNTTFVCACAFIQLSWSIISNRHRTCVLNFRMGPLSVTHSLTHRLLIEIHSVGVCVV